MPCVILSILNVHRPRGSNLLGPFTTKMGGNGGHGENTAPPCPANNEILKKTRSKQELPLDAAFGTKSIRHLNPVQYPINWVFGKT